MPLQRQLMPIQIGGGIDTKTDDKKVISSKLLTLENGLFTQPGKLNKRNGYQAIPLTILDGGTLTNPKGLKSLGNELVCSGESSLTPGEGRLFSFSDTAQAWVDKGKYQPSKVEKTIISNDNSQYGSCGQQMGTYVLSAWFVATNPNLMVGDLYTTILDTESNTFLIPETKIATNVTIANVGASAYPTLAARLVAGSKFGVFYYNSNSEVAVVLVTISGTTVTIGSEIQLTVDADLDDNCFAVIGTTTGAAIEYITVSRDITLIGINSAGAVTSTQIVTTPSGSINNFYLAPSSNGNIWLYFARNDRLKYAVFTDLLVPVLPYTDASAAITRRFVSIENSVSQQQVYYTRAGSGNPTVSEKITVDIAGTVGAPSLLFYDATIVSSPFVFNGRQYLIGLYSTRVQSFYVVIDGTDGNPVATALSGSAALNLIRLPNGDRPTALSSGKFGLVLTFLNGIGSDRPLGTALISFDFINADLHQALQSSATLIWNGGLITEYDGQPATELGFLNFPEITNAVVGTTGGGIADGQYSYAAVFQWTDNRGNLHQSSPSPPHIVSVTSGTGTSLVTLTISNLPLTLKKGPDRFPVQVAIFRTDANGTVYHQVIDLANPLPILNDPSTYTTFVDTNSDANIDANALIYTQGGVVDNIYPPASITLTNYNNRVWLIPSEDPNTAWYAKTVTPGVGLSFSDLLTAVIDQRGGPVTALAAFDDKIVFFKKTVPFFSVGDGANDLGLSATLSPPQIVASDVGCAFPKSIILNMPMGIMFKSEKGIYLLDRSLQAHYIGKEVEAYNAETVTSAVLDQKKSQIRFLVSSGVALVYDYIYAQWSTFTNHLGLAADIWQANYTYCRNDGDIYNETPGAYVDKTAAIILKVGTAWIKLTDIQNYQRVTKLFVVGEYKSPHLLNGLLYFDYQTSPLANFQFNPQLALGMNGDDDVYQFRYFMKHQRCESFRLVLSDDFTGVSPGEGYSLTQLSIEACLKPYGVRLSQYKSVG